MSHHEWAIDANMYDDEGDEGVQTPCSFKFMADSEVCMDCDMYLECLGTYEEVFMSV